MVKTTSYQDARWPLFGFANSDLKVWQSPTDRASFIAMSKLSPGKVAGKRHVVVELVKKCVRELMCVK
jgi:hypothetical protein